MPNHVKNVLQFNGIRKPDIDILINMLTTKDKDGTPFIDFNKIIPEPRVKSECPKDCLVNKDSHIMEYEDRPWFDWYTWHNKYWGTKWNAYDGYTLNTDISVTFVFSTAWCAPYPIIEKLRVDDFYDIFSDEELIEIIDESDYLWEDDELNPLDF